MEEVSLEILLNKVESIFKLTNLAAARAIELNAGMKKLVESAVDEKMTTVAIREIANDKVKIKTKK